MATRKQYQMAKALRRLMDEGQSKQDAWQQAAMEAGYQRTPSFPNGTIDGLLERMAAGRESSGQEELEEFFQTAVNSSAGGDFWQQVAPKARMILAKIAAGSIIADAQQVKTLTEIINRAEGRAGTQKRERTLGVVVLPTLDSGENTQLCPTCKAREFEDLYETALDEPE